MRDDDGESEVVWTALRLADGAFSKLSSVSRLASKLTEYLAREYELREKYPISPDERLYAWRHGFMSRDFVLLNLERNDPENYLSALQQSRYVSPAVNAEYTDVIRNKIAFHLSTNPHVDIVPALYGVVRAGEFHGGPESESERDFVALVESKGDVIVKPATGSLGRDVTHVSTAETGFRIDDDPASAADVRELVRERDRHVAVEYVENHEYAEEVFPGAVNTIRVLTVRDPDSDEFFVASAVHRFGNESTGVTDNWSGGGFAAPVDTDTGELGKLHTYDSETGLRKLECHPETGTRVTDDRVPRWEDVTDAVLEMAELHRENPYVGWDVVLTDDGPVVLEGNGAPHLALQQLGGGLLEDDRVERFLDSLE